jgi:hypothetical protein
MAELVVEEARRSGVQHMTKCMQGPEDSAAMHLSEAFATLAANPELHEALTKRHAIPALVLLLTAAVAKQVSPLSAIPLAPHGECSLSLPSHWPHTEHIPSS